MKTITIGKDNISYLSSNFVEHFGKMEVKEESVKRVQIRKLPRYMNDTKILAELKPEEVSLGFLLYALKYLDKEVWYIFYIRDAEGTLWAVSAGWRDRGWSVGAVSVSDPKQWYTDYHVVSRVFSDSKIETLSPSETLTLSDFISELKDLIRKYEN